MNDGLKSLEQSAHAAVPEAVDLLQSASRAGLQQRQGGRQAQQQPARHTRNCQAVKAASATELLDVTAGSGCARMVVTQALLWCVWRSHKQLLLNRSSSVQSIIGA